MEPELPKKATRFHEIDLLRFLAAIAVTLHHYAFLEYQFTSNETIHFPTLAPASKYGFLGVELFFIISGYVVLMSAYNKSIKQFFLSRVTRLYPAFWVCCTLTFLVVYFSAPPGESHETVGQYVYNMTMFQEYFGAVSIDGVYWTLTKEITFYFLIALVIGFGLMRSLDYVLLFWLLYTAVAGPNHPDNNGFSQLFIPAYSPFFIAGMVFFLLQRRMYDSWRLYGLLVFSFLLSMRSLVYIKGLYVEICHTSFSFPVMSGIVTVFFIIFGLIVFRKINLQHARWLSSLGALTYPVYLLHDRIGAFLLSFYCTIENRYFVLLGVILLMLGLAYLVHHLVEKKSSKPLGQRTNALLEFLSLH